jgi:hypothetical protein
MIEEKRRALYTTVHQLLHLTVWLLRVGEGIKGLCPTSRDLTARVGEGIKGLCPTSRDLTARVGEGIKGLCPTPRVPPLQGGQGWGRGAKGCTPHPEFGVKRHKEFPRPLLRAS